MNERFENHTAPTVAAADRERRSEALTLSDRVRSLRLPDQPARSSSGGGWFPWLLCLVLAGLSGYLGYRLSAAEDQSRADDSLANLTVGQSNAVEVSRGRLALSAGGYVVPVRRVQVSPKVGGEVLDLTLLDQNGKPVLDASGKPCELMEGMVVKKDWVIARLDPAKYEFEFRRCEALAAQAKADWDKMKAGNRKEEILQAKAALEETERMRDQLRDEAGRQRRSRMASSAEDQVKTESKLSQAEFKVEQLRQSFELMREGYRAEDKQRAEATYQLAEAQRDSAKYDRDNTRVVAPVDGIILKKYAEVGSTVRPEAYSNGLSASLCDMADLKQLEVDVDISERDLVQVFQGQDCDVRTEAFPEKIYKGKVNRLWPEATRSKASVSVRVRILVPDDETILRPEMRARVVFLAREKEKTATKSK